MNDFERDNEWQRRMRDNILAPLFYVRYSLDGRYVFIDKGRLASTLQKRFAVDTIAQSKSGDAVCIEEKIVRWPTFPNGKPKDRGYTAFALETQSCTVPGRESDGWMVYGKADYLLYCFANLEQTALICYLVDFPKLQAWFWEREHEFPPFQMLDTINRTRGRVVPIADVCEAVPVKSWLLETEADAA